MAAGKGLGKGLGALFGPELEEGPTGIPLRDIEPNRDQPRRRFDPEGMSELENSIRENGVITPITVRRSGKGYVIVAGERRWRAARSAGLDIIPAYVVDADEKQAYIMSLVENVQRKSLSPIEEAEGFRRLIEEYSMKQEEVAEGVGKSRPYVSNSLRLLSLPAQVQDMVSSGAITAGHARALLGLPEETLLEAAQMAAAQNLSVRETEALASRLAGVKPARKKAPPMEDLRLYAADLERTLSSRTSHTVKIQAGKKKGKVIIEYYGNEDLEEICRALEKITKT